ncbi:hypothetical protein MWU63_14825 [Pseudohalocynthiibacter sp. F2068]|nr:hypothetical protein [Pseudohalocynthiibacter sp. F2068]
MSIGWIITILTLGLVVFGCVLIVRREKRAQQQRIANQKHEAHKPNAGLNRAEQINKGGFGGDTSQL